MTLHIFETGSGEDWLLAYDEKGAIALNAEMIGEEEASEEGVTQIDDEKEWSMLWDPKGLPEGFASLPEVTIEVLEGGPCGDGWTHRVSAPARVWASNFERGPLASENY